MFQTESRRRRSKASLLVESFGLPQATLAEALGLSNASVSRILQGTQSAPDALAPVLCATLGRIAAARVLAAIAKETDR